MDKIKTNSDTTQAGADVHSFHKVIGRTLYEVSVHFSQTSTETMADKVERMVRNDAEILQI